MPESSSLPEVITSGIEAALEHVHTATIAIVDSYDGSTQRANVVSAVRRPLTNAAGEPVYEDFPPFESVPVVWARNRTGGLHGPLASGDCVLLVFLQIGIAEWRQRGGTQNAADTRTHSEGFPVAIAGVRPDLEPLPGVVGDAWELGFFGAGIGRVSIKSGEILLGVGATKPIALAQALAVELAKITSAVNSLISQYNTHTHTGGSVSGGAVTTIATTMLAPAMSAQVPANYTSTLVKATQ